MTACAGSGKDLSESDSNLLLRYDLLRKTMSSGHMALIWGTILLVIMLAIYPLSSSVNGFISYVAINSALDLVSIVVAVFYAQRLYRVGLYFRINSLKLFAIGWLLLSATSLLLIPLMYQYALWGIAWETNNIAQGIPSFWFLLLPFGSIEVMLSGLALILLASLMLAIVALDMKRKTGLAHFDLPAIITLTVASIATSIILGMVTIGMSIFGFLVGNYLVIGASGLFELTGFVIGIVIVLFNRGLRELDSSDLAKGLDTWGNAGSNTLALPLELYDFYSYHLSCWGAPQDSHSSSSVGMSHPHMAHFFSGGPLNMKTSHSGHRKV